MRFENPELMGLFGWTWQEKMAQNIGYKVGLLNGSVYVGIINSMNKVYKANKSLSDAELITLISEKTNQAPDYAARFLIEIKRREGAGGSYNLKSEYANKPKDIVESVTGISTGKIALTAGLLIGAYLLFTGSIRLPRPAEK